MQRNPYTLVFGKAPSQPIHRLMQTEEVILSFQDDDPSQQLYMITGIRGVGKTVFMTEIADRLKEDDRWVIVELNPERDLLQGLIAKLSAMQKFADIFREAKINLSFFGIDLQVAGAVPITDIEMAASRLLDSLKKHGKRVLILIDEASNTKTMREFSAAFQIWLRQDLPVFLLMTGLYENIDALQNQPSLTFLYRAPKIRLAPLNISAIRDNYRDNFNLSEEDSLQMARLTKGYPFAFQVLGYLTWRNNGNYRSVISEYRNYLEEYVYQKIWSELSDLDKKTAYAVATSETGKTSDIREIAGMSNNQFNQYRRRMLQKGIVDVSEFGRVRFILPMFAEFVKDNYYED